MVLRAKLPKTLIVSNAERYNPNRQGERVPGRFVPEVEHIAKDKTTGKSLTVKFKISLTVKKMYKVLIDGGTETFINHIKVLWCL